MNDYEKTIKDLQDRVKLLEDRLTLCNGAVAEPKKWSPIGGEWFIGCDDSVHNYPSRNDYKVFERPTKEQAERALVEMRKFNRLLALRDELCGNELVDFNDNKFKYYVYFSHADKSWHIDFNDEHEVIMPYFTSRESAQKACGMLNSGEVEL